MDELAIDVASFRNGDVAIRGPAHLIVKSQDQVERRARLIESKRRGRIGRIEQREIAVGLWARLVLPQAGKIDRASCRVTEFPEPRGLVSLDDSTYLISDVNRVLRVDSDARILREYAHPFFAFLHSISFDRLHRRFLAVSSGYDCLVEMDLEGKVCWEWFAWENGFDTTLDGVHLCREKSRLDQLQAEGKSGFLVDPAELGPYGLMTSQRSNHPNSACYHPSKSERVLATLGHSGEVIEIDKPSGKWRTVIPGLQSMPHAIQPYRNGWLVTNTLMGEFWLLDERFAVRSRIVTRNLPGKPPEMANHEWLQAAYPTGDSRFIAADANRGLLAIDLDLRQYCIYPVDESWCVHHIVMPQ